MKHFFTSINNAYVPKAVVLAESLRRAYGNDAYVTCMLSDCRRADIDYSAFDDVLTIDDINLPVPSVESWIFKHTVVELCTAVKPWAFKRIFAKHNAESVVYLDPDTVVYSPLDEVDLLLNQHPVVLTPHVTKPATHQENLLDGEMLGSLRHGVFNLGFLALAIYGEGEAFLEWWAERCLDWCYDDAPKGLFTDQRWVDLAPCFFDTLHFLRHPGYNMATWNLYYRKLGRDRAGALTVNDNLPLRFFHFSGFDIGTYEIMLNRHAPRDKVLADLSRWYILEQERFGQRELGRRPGHYDFFGSGERIDRAWRIVYRESPELASRFPLPYSDPGFENWLRGSFMPESIPTQLQSPGRFVQIVNRIRSNNPKVARYLYSRLPENLRNRLRDALG
jgi:hypothetical protein